MTMRRLLSDVVDIADEKLSGKRYHYSNSAHKQPIQKRAANAVMGFWFRMILIGLAFSFLSSASMIYMAWSQEKAAEEAAAAEAEEKAKRNPWALKKK